MAPSNPYAPPSAECEPPPIPLGGVQPLEDPEIQAALARLDEHLSDGARVEADRRLGGFRLRVVTIVIGLLTIAMIATIGIAFGVITHPDRAVAFVLIPFGAIFFVIWLVLLIQDLTLVGRSKARDPLTALRGYFRAAKMGQAGYAIACLCPTAREQSTPPPQLPDYPVSGGPFTLSIRKEMTRYLRTWACPGAGHVRYLTIKRLEIVERMGDRVCAVRGEVSLTAWPQWANILSVVLFLVIRLIGLVVALVLYYTLRKRATVVVQKVLLRSRDGIYYLLDPGLAR